MFGEEKTMMWWVWMRNKVIETSSDADWRSSSSGKWSEGDYIATQQVLQADC